MPNIQQSLNQTLRKILAALIRTLLRNGMAYGEFDQIARKCFVDVAYQHFSSASKKQTVSNVAILTGLNRKEVKKLRELDADQSLFDSKQYNRSIRVIGGWMNDPLFQNSNGQPVDLDYEGDVSFSTLVKLYSGDMPVAAMQKSLEKTANISINNGKIRLISHAYLPSDDPVEKVSILGTDTAQLIETINHNITANSEDLHFQRKASNHQVNPDAIPEIKQFLQRKGQAFLEEVDLYLSQHETEDSASADLSISVFYHETVSDNKEPPS